MTAPPTTTHRFLLTRTIDADNPKTLLFIGVNPSTADQETDDATIRRMVAFARDLGCGVLLVANLFAQRATDVKHVHAPTDDVRNLEDLHLVLCALAADVVVCGWGPPGKLAAGLRLRWIEVVDMLQALDVPMNALHITKDGHPGHPLYLPADVKLRPWPEASHAES